MGKNWLASVLASQFGNIVDILDDMYNITGKYQLTGKSVVRQLVALEIVKYYAVGKIMEAIINKLLQNRNFRPCVDAVNVRWKSQMGLLLYGIIDELPY